MASIQPFDFEGTPVRTLTYETGNTWFLAKDVCQVLDIRTDSIRTILDDDEVATVNPNTVGVAQNGGRDPLIVSEPGLYGLIFKSRKPQAEEFKRWVKHTVLPQIRKHGAYMSPEVIERTLLSPDYLIQLATQLKQEQEARQAAELLTARQAQRIDVLEPKARALDDFTGTKHSYSLADAAKILSNGGRKLGQNRLVAYLLEIGWVFRKEGSLKPYSDRVDGGYLDLRAYPTRLLNGKSKTFPPQVRVQTKGLAAIWRTLYGTKPSAQQLQVAA